MCHQTSCELYHRPPFAGPIGGQESQTGDTSSDAETFGCVPPSVIYHSLSTSSRSPGGLRVLEVTPVFPTGSAS
jgi:hypothetical protein